MAIDVCRMSCQYATDPYGVFRTDTGSTTYSVLCSRDEVWREEGYACPYAIKPMRDETQKAASDDAGPDPVNHPSHYETGQFECKDVMLEVFGAEKVLDFYLLNTFKYLYRCCRKHEEPSQDVEKAGWYIDHWIELDRSEQERRKQERYDQARSKFESLAQPLRGGDGQDLGAQNGSGCIEV